MRRVSEFEYKYKVGDQHKTKEGFTLTIIENLGYSKVRVRFCDHVHNERVVGIKELLKGNIKNLLHPSVRSVGFYGIGPHKAKDSDGKNTKEYMHWLGMLTRCYTDDYKLKFPTYQGCYVDRQWHNFQEFAEWCKWQKGFDYAGSVLDKDMLVAGNKVYSPETCLFLPNNLNSLIVTQKRTDKSVPAGISFQNGCQKYIVSCAVDGKNKNLGRYKCPEEAFNVYKNFKNDLVKKKAEEYKDVLDERAYTAMLNFKIEERV